MLKIIVKKYAIILLPILLLPILLLVSFHQAMAQDHARGRGGNGWGIGYSFITAGGEAGTVMYRPNRYASFRLVSAGIDYDEDVSETKNENSYDYTQAAALGSDAFILNLHPFRGRFYFAFGVSNFELSLALDGSAERTGVNPSADDIPPELQGIVTPDVEFTFSAEMGASIAFTGPSGYAGIGLGTKHADKKGLGLRFEIGVIQVSDPEIDLYVRNINVVGDDEGLSEAVRTETTAELEAKSEEYEEELKEKFKDDYALFPVIEFGISYHF
ncbi:MAG: hypothetical protein K0U45_04005 [Alphaproteobacteria bacterium]|nr:hypothetical protein [Alphaproteobacteria bacterium]